MANRTWLLIGVLAVVLSTAYLAYDWTRPCEGGPVKQFVTAFLNGGSFRVRCAG